MAFDKSIDAPGNRHQRRVVAAIQRTDGKEARLAAAQAKRQRKMAREFERGLGKTIVFYNQPVHINDPDGAYLSPPDEDGRRQVIVAGELKASIDHYVKAAGIFLKKPMRFVSSRPMTRVPGPVRSYIELIMEPG